MCVSSLVIAKKILPNGCRRFSLWLAVYLFVGLSVLVHSARDLSVCLHVDIGIALHFSFEK